MGVLTRANRVPSIQVKKPASYVKGEAFQDFIRKQIFPLAEYAVLEKTPSFEANWGDFIESTTNPDFKFRSRRTGGIFFVEAKYRSVCPDRGIRWCKPYQWARYVATNKETPVFIVLGLGTYPSSPERVFLLPVQRIKYLRLFPSFLKEYEIPRNQSVNTDKLIALLGEN